MYCHEFGNLGSKNVVHRFGDGSQGKLPGGERPWVLKDKEVLSWQKKGSIKVPEKAPHIQRLQRGELNPGPEEKSLENRKTLLGSQALLPL